MGRRVRHRWSRTGALARRRIDLDDGDIEGAANGDRFLDSLFELIEVGDQADGGVDRAAVAGPGCCRGEHQCHESVGATLPGGTGQERLVRIVTVGVDRPLPVAIELR